MGEFRMPSLGADMDHGTIVEWRVKPGDVVHKGDVVAVVDTEKSDIEVEIFESGVIESIVVAEGEEVPVGAVLALVSSDVAPPAETPPVETPPAETPPAPEPKKKPRAKRAPKKRAPEPVPAHHTVVSPVVRHLAEHEGLDLDAVPASGPAGLVRRADVERAVTAAHGPAAAPAPASAGVRASPYARRLAREQGRDLSTVAGSGPGGAVVAADLAAPTAAPAPVPAPAPEAAPTAAPRAAKDRQAAMRHAIAVLMARSKREIPHYYLHATIDLSTALAWLEARNAERPVTERLLPSVLLLKASALAAREVPAMNGFWIDDAFQPADHVHLGVAISLRGGGLIAPAIHDADLLPLDELMAALRDLVNRARAQTLRSSEMADPTLTVTNLGEQGVEAVYGVIYPPQVALVGFGAVVHRPWAVDGLLGVRPIVTATLAADHRASDGHVGARYLLALERRLQEPDHL